MRTNRPGWNIRAWPTIYILDDQGMIRHNSFLQGAEVDAAVDQLVKEVERKPTP